MKRTATAFFALALILVSSVAFAQTPELRGTWKGTSFLTTDTGFKEGNCAYVIDKQEGQLFVGYKLYFDTKGVLQKEKFTGIFGDDGNLYFAERGDGYAFGHRTGKQTMSIYYLEQGATNKAILYKLERVHFTTGFVEIDKDGNSVILRAEVSNHYPLNAERIMEEADKNKDGKLTKKEWESWKTLNK
ncbi:calcium-binding protein [uncultured Pseudodesulfovibrio sp.]|uniref:calcium-binding protein n=1 Tax=uncultured Pseudodesulfovibrio sp. TaxID=2035858 RepID=UPI0029C9473B|nr:calcium-binding protein [uncultured Pseudodesulfovibrio sp.]